MNTDTSKTRLPDKKNRDEFNLIFRELYPRLLAYGELFLDHDSAEDVVQDLMVNLWVNSDKIEIHTSLESYLFRSVYRSCLNRIKSNRIRERYRISHTATTLEEAEYYDPDENETIKKIFSLELGHEINEAIASLPEKCREVFIKSYIRNQKTKEIAAELNISERTAEAHIYNALKHLRIMLKDKFIMLALIQYYW